VYGEYVLDNQKIQYNGALRIFAWACTYYQAERDVPFVSREAAGRA